MSENSKDFWRKVNSSDISDKDNPFLLVNSFLKNYPNSDLANKNLDLDMINSILKCHLTNFQLTPNEFNVLRNIKPLKFELPVTDSSLVELIGKYTRNGLGKAGVYKFTNKDSGFSYVGSSISLANRLFVGYLGSKLGNRVIDLAIKESGLERFYLEIYLIPDELINSALTHFEGEYSGNSNTEEKVKRLMKNFSLTLEQILILLHNPEYNVLKVAGSPAGNPRSLDSMLPSLLKNSKVTYLIDNETNKIIYKAESRTELAKVIDVYRGNISTLISKKELFLGRLTVSESPLDESVYTTDLMNPDDLLDYVNEIRTIWKKERMKNVDSTRSALNLKLSNSVELTNVKTNEVLIFPSLRDTAKYIQKFFDKVSPGTLSVIARKKGLYKGTFKLRYLREEDSLISDSNKMTMKSQNNLSSGRRSYSTKNNKAYFENVFSKKDAESPFAIVSNFF